MLSSIVLVLMGATGATGLDPGVEALPCPNPVSAWTGAMGPVAIRRGIAADADGGILICGDYWVRADLDPSEAIYQPESHGYTMDAYVVKVNAEGSLAWAYTVGGDVDSDTAEGVAVAADGSVIAAGTFQGPVDFDPTDAIDEHRYSGDYAAFVTKLGADGTYLWTVSFGGPGWVMVNGVVLDADGNILLVGFCDDAIDFDPGPGEVWRYCQADFFVSKLAPDGSHLWTNVRGNNSAFDSGRDIAVDADGNIYASGTFRGTVDFDPGDGVDLHTMAGPYEDVFVTKYYPDRSYAWTRTYDVPRPGTNSYIAVAGDGGVLLTGSYNGTLDFDPGEGIDHRTSVEGSADIFVTKLTAQGSYEWTYTAGGTGPDGGQGVTVAADGSVLITGYFRDAIDFDPGVRVDLHESAGDSDLFVTKLSPNGTYHWTRTLGGERTDDGKHVATGAKGNAYLVGSYWQPVEYWDYDPGCEISNQPSHDETAAHTLIVKLVCPELSADFDGNGVVDLRDAAEFQFCFTDEGPATCGDGCSRLDLDPDDDIDLDDYLAFRKRLTGPQPRELITPTSPITTHRERPGDTSIRAPSVSAGCDR